MSASKKAITYITTGYRSGTISISAQLQCPTCQSRELRIYPGKGEYVFCECGVDYTTFMVCMSCLNNDEHVDDTACLRRWKMASYDSALASRISVLSEIKSIIVLDDYAYLKFNPNTYFIDGKKIGSMYSDRFRHNDIMSVYKCERCGAN